MFHSPTLRTLPLHLLLVTGLCGAVHGHAQAKPRATGHYVLTIDGEPAIVKSVEGGTPKARAQTSMKFVVDLTPAVVSWLVDTLSGELAGSDIALLEIDEDGDVVSEVRLQQAQITEVTIPKLDGSSKDASFTVRGRPDAGRAVAPVDSDFTDWKEHGRGGDVRVEAEGAAANDIEAIVIKQTTTEKAYEAYAIVSPRDAASGLATGKRQHKPIQLQLHSDEGDDLTLQVSAE